jgi:hypothetical protein
MYNNLPGILVNTVDGGLAVQRQPVADSTLVISTSGQGVANQPYQVVDRTKAALEFGLQGNLIRGMEEAASNSDNLILFRMGTAPMTLTGIGADSTPGALTAGFGLEFGQVQATAATDYKVWYKAGVLAVYFGEALIYSNDPLQTTDNGDLTIDGLIAGNAGLQIGTGASATLANAITVQAAAALAGVAHQAAPTLTACVTGLGLTGRQQFVALLKALDLLQGFQVKQIVVPEALFNAPNVAFYVAGDATTSLNNPVTNPSALDWLKTSADAYGNLTFQWASETTDSNGTAVAAFAGVTLASRKAAGFSEVNWGYTLANFCASVSMLGNECIGFIGTTGPASYKLVDVRKWVGYLPKYDANGVVTTAGAGLLGIAYTAGTDTAHLNPLCVDFASGSRKPGFFQTASGQYDDAAEQDINQNPIDIGAYLHVVADQAILSNGFATNYVSNIATFVAGICGMLDEKRALTNLSVSGIQQLPGLTYTPGQLDALTQVNINVLKTKTTGPALLHDKTCATDASDYTQVLRVRIKGLVVATMLAIGDPFVGASSLDGLQLTSLKTALDTGLSELSKRGYINSPSVVIKTTAAEQRIGHADLFLKFHPADQMVQLNAYVGLTR